MGRAYQQLRRVSAITDARRVNDHFAVTFGESRGLNPAQRAERERKARQLVEVGEGATSWRMCFLTLADAEEYYARMADIPNIDIVNFEVGIARADGFEDGCSPEIAIAARNSFDADPAWLIAKHFVDDHGAAFCKSSRIAGWSRGNAPKQR